MSIKRMDHVVVVVEDLPRAVAFFEELGLEAEASTAVEGPWVDRVNGMDDVRADITMMRTPDGNGRLEVSAYRSPALVPLEPHPAPPNALGLRSVMFEVDDVAGTVARMRDHGAELIGEIADYEDIYRLCYLRGPGGIIVALAQDLR